MRRIPYNWRPPHLAARPLRLLPPAATNRRCDLAKQRTTQRGCRLLADQSGMPSGHSSTGTASNHRARAPASPQRWRVFATPQATCRSLATCTVGWQPPVARYRESSPWAIQHIYAATTAGQGAALPRQHVRDAAMAHVRAPAAVAAAVAAAAGSQRPQARPGGASQALAPSPLSPLMRPWSHRFAGRCLQAVRQLQFGTAGRRLAHRHACPPPSRGRRGRQAALRGNNTRDSGEIPSCGWRHTWQGP